MCDGYAMFAAAFERVRIDMRAYDIVSNALENASETPVDAQTADSEGKTTPKGETRVESPGKG